MEGRREVELVEKELEGVLEELKGEGLSAEEVAGLLAPLRPFLIPTPTRPRLELYGRVKGWVKAGLSWGSVLGLLVLLALLLFDPAFKIKTRFHGLAVLRIALIKVRGSSYT
jgi:hypothetical protein